MEKLITRCENFISELGVPVTVFCRNINLSVSGYRAWKRGELKLSEDTTKRIENYLIKYGF